MDNPCYDRLNKKDCPRRKAGCAVGCPDWDEYLKAREEYRRKQREEADVTYVLSECRAKNHTEWQKNHIHSRQGRR